MLPQLPNRQVQFAILDVVPLSRRAPASVVDALFWLHDDLVHF